MTVRRAPAALALVALAAALVFGGRYRQLDAAVTANRRALAAGLRPAPGAPADADPSRRVAAAVERDEPLFDATLVLMAGRRAAGWLSGACLLAAVACGALAVRPTHERS